MEVWPHIGGKVASIVDKADRYELLFHYPAEVPLRPRYDVPYSDSWCAGWDECFPAPRASRYVGHPYDGIHVPDRGEVWGLPPTAVPTRDGITMVWHGLRFGYRLTRKLFLDGPSVRAEYTLVNLAPFDFRFVWSMGGLLSIRQPVRLRLPRRRMRSQAWVSGHVESDDGFEWPMIDGALDLSYPEALPGKQAWHAIGTAPIDAPVAVEYPTRDRKLSIAYEPGEGLAAYWGAWINTGGWCGHRHVGVGPLTGRYGELDASIHDHSAGTVGPLAKLTWAVALTVGGIED